MNNVVAMVLAGGRVDELLALTEKRPKAALPVFGTYRIIDFVLSNMMHSGLWNVGVLSQFRPYSLMRHIGTGEQWDFIGRQRGVRILPPYQGYRESDWYKGTADAVYQNLSYIDEFGPEHVLIAAGDHIYRMDYRHLMDFHIERKADLTVCFTRVKEKSSWFGYGIIDENGVVKGYQEKPKEPRSAWASMTIYMFRKGFLADVLKDNARASSHEFGRDIIPKVLSGSRVFGFKFTDLWAYARTIDSYYETNQALLRQTIDLKKWQIRTNTTEGCGGGDRLPAHIDGRVSNSVVSEGCMVLGDVINSILSPGVVVGPGAVVTDSIVFHDSKIGSNSKLTKVICDKYCTVEKNVDIGNYGKSIASQEYGKLLNSGITVLGRGSRILPGTKIGANTVVYSSAKIDAAEIPAGSVLR